MLTEASSSTSDRLGPYGGHQLIHPRLRQERFHEHAYVEEGTTTTPFDLLAMDGVDLAARWLSAEPVA